MYRLSHKLMEQIKLFEAASQTILERNVNDFICNLGCDVEIKDVSYSLHNNRLNNLVWSAMVRYADPHLRKK